jgi:signal transduction histidine kinase/CheY-like chemotaxis protein
MNLNKKLWQYINDDVAEVENTFVIYGYLLLIGYLGFYFFNLLIATPVGYENLPIRITIALLGLGLILKNYWPNKAKLFMPLYWYATLVYSLPFFFFFMLLHNLESNIWQVNGFVGITMLIFFVDWIVYIILISIGISLAYIIFSISNGFPHFSYNLIAIFGSYVASIISLILCFHQRKKLYQKKQLAEKELNNQLVRQAAELQKAFAIKTEFLNNLSHEVRTPISGVVNISELLLENWHKYSEEERYKNMQTIAQSGSRLLMVMNSILDLSRFTSGKMSMKMSVGNLQEAIMDMVLECESLYLYHNKNIVIETEIQPGINSNVVMDSERVTQVLRNLIGNAVKFTTSGKIKIFLGKQGKNLEVIVEDDGVGIPEDELEEIFYPFVQSSRTKNTAGGTGLGLAICREIVIAHQGKIWAENNYNKGASIHFMLPQAELLDDVKPVKIASDITFAPTKGVGLMIDDDTICHNIIHMILKNEGYDIVSAYGGIEGLEYLQKHKDEIDFVLLDLMMPDMHGVDVLREIKSDKSLQHIPVIIQSATNDTNECYKAGELGAAGFFSKPYDRSSIVLFINIMLGKRK